MGKKIQQMKGHYFTLLGSEESDSIRPILEDLIAERTRKEQEDAKKKKGEFKGFAKMSSPPKADNSKNQKSSRSSNTDATPVPKSDNIDSTKLKRKSWLERKQAK